VWCSGLSAIRWNLQVKPQTGWVGQG
jgi:hypothetical protein